MSATFPAVNSMYAKHEGGIKDAQEFRGRPDQPQDVRATATVLGALITWLAPAKRDGLDGYRIYKGNEFGRPYWSTKDPSLMQAHVQLPGGGANAIFFVCAVSTLGRESPKIDVIASSTTDKVVTTGTGGATPGTYADPPDKPDENVTEDEKRWTGY